jgi:lipopolysaccharide transport system ATP-binding protein
MNKPMITVRNLSKKYTLGERQPYYSFRDSISGFLHKPFRKEKLQKDEFWALRDVSFDINEGDVVGVIGRNGAGKSTLLKILSRITPPTEGEIVLRGRVASLLEVGTGFHPELTGRENIYLNGAILGMKRWEINNKFDEIVEFAEISKFLDTPVKHYSSGMYMRLAFAVAAHLEPEILLVDEVLAVGDTQFQKKCIGKMSEVSKQGRTVLFVSHNMVMIKSLCTKCLLLKSGQIVKQGATNQVVDKYLEDFTSDQRNHLDPKVKSTFFKEVIINNNKAVISGQPIIIEIIYGRENNKSLDRGRLSIAVNDMMGNFLFVCSTEMTFKELLSIPGKGIISCYISKLPLSRGMYRIDLFGEANGEIIEWIRDAFILEVEDGKYFNGLRQIPNGFDGKGVLVDHEWKFRSN